MEPAITVLAIRASDDENLSFEAVNLPNSLEAMQAFVGGYLEEVSVLGGRFQVICDEEGRLKGKPLTAVVDGIRFCGDVFVTKVDDEGNMVSLNDDDLFAITTVTTRIGGPPKPVRSTSTIHAKFKLGQIVATPGALDALARNQTSATSFIVRHATGDWGDLDEEDRNSNEEAVKHEGELSKQGRTFSAYRLEDGTKVWVITEYDRSITTVLLPEDY